MLQIKRYFYPYIHQKKLTLSNSSKHAIKAVPYLTVNSSAEHKILVKELSVRTNVPQAYLSKLLKELSKHNMVSLLKGRGGSFFLPDENLATDLMDIINFIDGDNHCTTCMLNLSKCNVNHPCPMHDVVGETKTDFVKNLQETTVEDLVSDIRKGRNLLPL